MNAGSDELAAFDGWLGPAIDYARRDMGHAFEPAYQASVGMFIFHGDGKGDEPPTRGIVGAWAASGDNAGRLYPMVVFGSYDYNHLVSAGAALPIALWPLLSAAYECVTAGRNLPVPAFLERVGRIALPSLESPQQSSAGYREWLAGNPIKAFWDTGFASDANRFWVVQNIAASVEPFLGQEHPKTHLGIRLPLGSADAYATALWMDMTARLAKWNRTLLNAFWVPRQSLLLHLGPPHIASFREIIAPTGDADHVADLCGMPTVDEATSRRLLGAKLDSVVTKTDQSLAEFLEALSSA